jgi:Holliday junction DNA helicase RuvA
MISRIEGRIVVVTEESVTVELNGLFYELMIPSGIYSRLKEAQGTNLPITLYTLYYIEAGDRKSYHYPRLVGFTDPVDKEFFQHFTTVSGLGVKKALKALTLPIREIAAAIETKNAGVLSRLPGIGGRLADKVIAELSGKMARFALAKGEQPLVTPHKGKENYFNEAMEVLLQLQYKRPEAEKMIENALAANPKIDTAEKLISTIFNQTSSILKSVSK